MWTEMRFLDAATCRIGLGEEKVVLEKLNDMV
jgi:hypothetical protein